MVGRSQRVIRNRCLFLNGVGIGAKSPTPAASRLRARNHTPLGLVCSFSFAMKGWQSTEMPIQRRYDLSALPRLNPILLHASLFRPFAWIITIIHEILTSMAELPGQNGNTDVSRPDGLPAYPAPPST